MATVPNIRLLQTKTGTFTAQSTNFAVTPDSTTTAGSGCYLYFFNGVSATTPEVTSISGGGTWTKVDSSTNGVTSSELWYVENVSAVSSFTVTPALAITGGWIFGEFSGILASGSLDTSAKANTASGAWSFTVGPTGTRQDAVSLVLECDCQQNGGVGGGNNTPSGFTQAAIATYSGSSHAYMNYKIRVAAVSTESATVSGSSASSSAVTSIIAVFRPVALVIQQRQVVSSVGSTTATVTAPLANSRQLLQVSRAASGGTLAGASTVTQTGTSWTRVGIIQGTGGTAEIWYSDLCTGSEGTTVTLGNSSAYVFSEWTNLSTSTLLDQGATANTAGAAGGGPTTIASASITPTNGPQLVLCVFSGYINAKSGTWGSPTGGFYSLGSFTAGGQSVMGAFKVLATAAASSSTVTLVTTLSTNTYPTYIASFFQSAPSSSSVLRRMLNGVGY